MVTVINLQHDFATLLYTFELFWFAFWGFFRYSIIRTWKQWQVHQVPHSSWEILVYQWNAQTVPPQEYSVQTLQHRLFPPFSVLFIPLLAEGIPWGPSQLGMLWGGLSSPHLQHSARPGSCSRAKGSAGPWCSDKPQDPSAAPQLHKSEWHRFT